MTLPRLKKRRRPRIQRDGLAGDAGLQGRRRAAQQSSRGEKGRGGEEERGLEKALYGLKLQLLQLKLLLVMVVMVSGDKEVGLMLHGSPVVTQPILRGLGHSLKDSYAATDASLSLHQLLYGWAVLLRLVLISLMLSGTTTLNQACNHVSTDFPERLCSSYGCLSSTRRPHGSGVSDFSVGIESIVVGQCAGCGRPNESRRRRLQRGGQGRDRVRSG